MIKEVRKRAALADLPIVAVTSLAMPGDRERLLSSGFQGYLSKPIDTRTFGPTVEAFLRPKAGRGSVAAAPPGLRSRSRMRARGRSAVSGEARETVLVIDDNLQNREVAEGHLVSAGYSAVLAESGESGLARFQERRPDLILLDVVMPRMDGFETCRRCARCPTGSTCRSSS